MARLLRVLQWNYSRFAPQRASSLTDVSRLDITKT